MTSLFYAFMAMFLSKVNYTLQLITYITPLADSQLLEACNYPLTYIAQSGF